MPAIPKPEIMSPAGNWTCLHAALDAGADAIYFGLRGLNMRANSRSFELRDLKRIATTCHKVGARAYLALNTIIYEDELGKIDRILTAAKRAGIDAVIAWDYAVIQKAVTIGLPVNLSTQASASNSSSVAFFFKTFGITRVVLARECTLDQIRSLRKKLKSELGPDAERISIEVFAHGAMCVSVSGRCFMSETRYGKSANRGECTQPCRREYKLVDDEGKTAFRLGSDYVMSPEDLCTLPFLEKLLDAGVGSLKIEGRGRAPEYVDTVTRVYRRAVDFYCENKGKRGYLAKWKALKAELAKDLAKVYNRGQSSGFFMGQPLDQWTDTHGSSAKTTKKPIGPILKYYAKAGAAEIKVENAEFKPGDTIMIQGPTTGVVTQKIKTIQVGHEAKELASRGEKVGIAVSSRVRRNDMAYLVITK